jgi:predicted DNA-binding ribbon-helix-helix protein
LREPYKPRTINHAGWKAAVRLEPVMWEALEDIAREQSTTIGAVVRGIAAQQAEGDPLSSAIRVYIVEFYRSQRGTTAPLDKT